MADTPDQFKAHEDYPELIDDTRAPALPVGAPAITRMVAFWKPNGVTREKWAEQIEKFVLDIYHRQVAVGNSPVTPSLVGDKDKKEPQRLYLLENHYPADPNDRVPQKIRKPSRRHQSVRLSLIWEGAPVLLNFEVHDELFMLSSSIDLSKTKPPQLGPNARKLAEDMVDFSATVEGGYGAVKSGKREETAFDISEKVNDTVYRHTWNALYKALFAEPLKAVKPENLGGYFADSRSFLAALENRDGKMVLPGHAVTSPYHTEEPRPFDPREAYNYAKTLLPFMTAETKTASQDTEYTFSAILGCQGLLATALGIAPPETPKEVRPQTELLVITRDRQWQTGRLIERGHHIGVLRLAALHDLKRLNAIDGTLEALESRLQQIAQGFSKPEGKEEHEIDVKSLSADLLKISKDLAGMDKGIEGGLANRLARSHIYQQEFAKLVAEMRLSHIDGFQPYDQFVRRRLGANYDYINTLRQRHGRIQEQISSLGRQLRTAQGLQLQEQIAEQTGVIQEHMGQLARFNDTIRRIQVEGVKFLVPPLTYYLCGALFH